MGRASCFRRIWALLLRLFLLCSLCRWTGLASVAAVDFSTPPSWTRTTYSLSAKDRLQLVTSALPPLIAQINHTSGTIDIPDMALLSQAASLTWVLVLSDLYTRTTTQQSLVAQNFQAFPSAHPGYNGAQLSEQINSDPLIWGLVACYAHRAYGDSLFLQIAESIWNVTSAYMVTQDQALSGSQSARNVSISTSCKSFVSPDNNATVAGGVFWVPTAPSSCFVNAETVGPFLAVSAYLSQTTGDSKYSTAASLTAAFIQNFMFNEIVLDGVSLDTCDTSASNFGFTYDAGFVLEGLCFWANASGESTWRDFANEIVVSSVKTPIWNNADGVVFEELNQNDADDYHNGFKGFLMRGLHSVWSMNDPSSDVSQLISTYITVQANALTNDATKPGTNIYTSNWTGPPLSDFHPYSQITALHALTPFFDITNNVSRSTSPSADPSSSRLQPSQATTSPTGNRTSSGSRSNHGGIIGAVVASVLVLLLLFLFCYLRRRRRERCLPWTNARRGAEIASIEPFATRNALAPIVERHTTPPSLNNSMYKAPASVSRAGSQLSSAPSSRPSTFISRESEQPITPSTLPPSYASRTRVPSVDPVSPALTVSTAPPSFGQLSIPGSNELLPAYSR